MSTLPMDRSRDAEPIRLFKSDFLEFFTHISPVAIALVWGPIIILLLLNSVLRATSAAFPWHIPLGIISGMALWTFAEYTIHRFVFHYHPKRQRFERMFFLFHGVHHAQPHVKTRLVMPFPVSIPLAAAFYGLFYLVMAIVIGASAWINPLMAGFVMGYLVYDLTHYATHHFPMRWGYAKFLKRYHMLHHFKADTTRFGVTSPIWDWAFGTIGVE